MPVRAWIERVATTWKTFRPARRRRASARFSVETFEPRRMLSAFVVNSLADTHDAIPGDGIAADANGFATLRAALEESNALAGADTIALPAGVVALSASNGPLVVSDDVTIVGGGASAIDGSAFDEIFSVHGTAHLQLDHVTAFSSGSLAASLRPTLLTSNTRQADLIVAFSATPSSPFLADSKITTVSSPLIGTAPPDFVFDEPLTTSVAKSKTLDELAVPTPEQAIDQIINALFRNEPDFVVPVSAEQKPGLLPNGNARPMSKTDSDEKPASPNADAESKPEAMSSDDETSAVNSDNEAVGAILRGWADEAGWGEFDFLTRGPATITAQPRHASRLAVLAGAVLSGVVTNAWSRKTRGSWRDSLFLTAWRTRFERLRQRAR